MRWAAVPFGTRACGFLDNFISGLRHRARGFGIIIPHIHMHTGIYRCLGAPEVAALTTRSRVYRCNTDDSFAILASTAIWVYRGAISRTWQIAREWTTSRTFPPSLLCDTKPITINIHARINKYSHIAYGKNNNSRTIFHFIFSIVYSIFDIFLVSFGAPVAFYPRECNLPSFWNVFRLLFSLRREGNERNEATSVFCALFYASCSHHNSGQRIFLFSRRAVEK